MQFDHSSCLSPAFPSLSSLAHSFPNPISRYEAELQWEHSRLKVLRPFTVDSQHLELSTNYQVRARINSLPTFSFERTKLEYDEAFYATFPEARQAAMDLWIAQQYPYAEWLHSFSFERVPINIEGDQCSSSYIPTSIREPRPTSKFSTYTLAQALTDSPPTRTFSSPTHSDSHAKASQYRTVSESLSSPCPTLPPAQQEDLEQVLFTLEVLAPARRPLQRSARNTRSIHLRSSPYMPLASRNPKLIHRPSLPSLRSTHSSSSLVVPSSAAPFEQTRYSGDWQTDAMAVSKHLHASANSIAIMENPVVSLPCLLPLPEMSVVTPTHSKDGSCKPTPCTPLPLRSCTPEKFDSTSTVSDPAANIPPLPRKRSKLLRDKDGKPILACFFCRGRKIACGPPPMGSDDPTCNQCARRGRACHYPTESRRGMRKPKTVDVDAPVVGPSSSSASCNPKSEAVPLSDDSDSEWDGDDC